jgi:hypothetical protein
MLDICGRFLYCSFVPLSLALFVATLYKLRHLSAPRRIVVACLFSSALAVTLTVAWVTILLRDGLGPDMVSSEGWVALRRSFPDMFGGLLVGLPLALTGAFLRRSRPVHKDA